jgi:hypothetical protein
MKKTMKNLKKTNPVIGAMFVLPAALLACASAHAQLLSSESFSGYTVGSPITSDIPAPTVAGYTGNWTAVDFGTKYPTATAGSLSYGGAGYAASPGNNIAVPSYSGGIAAGNSGRVYRLLDSTTTVTSSTVGTLYLSWLFQDGNQAGSAGTVYQTLDLYNGAANSNGPRAFNAGITTNGGQSGDQYNFGVNEAYTSTGVNVDAGVHLFVAEFNLSANNNADSVTTWLDPTLGANNPAGGITVSGVNIAFDHLAISDYASNGTIGNSGAWSNIRFGTTFNSVTIAPVPEPSTLALGGLGFAALCFYRRKARA